MTTGKTQDGATLAGARSAGAGEEKAEAQPTTEVDSGEVQAAVLTSHSTEASSPTSLTPGSGGLAALLAEKRANAGKIAGSESGPTSATGPTTQERATPAGAAFDALEITAVGGPAGDKPASVNVNVNVDVDGGKPSGVVRQTRLTPGSGKIAALLAQTRAEATKTLSGDAKAQLAPTPARVIPPVAAVDEQGITKVNSSARDELADSQTVSVEKSPVGEPRPTRITPVGGGLTTLLANTRARIAQDIHDRTTPLVAGDVVNVSTAGVVAVHSLEPSGADQEGSSAQVKNSSFSATLPGVPAPVVDPSGAVDLITERNVAAPGDTSEASTFGERVSVDQQRPRFKEPVGEPRPKRRPRVIVGLGVVAAMVVVAVVLIVPRNRVRSEKASLTLSASQPTAVVAGQLPSEPSSGPSSEPSSPPPAAIAPTADQPVGIAPTPGQPPEVPTVAAPQQAANPAAKPDQPAMDQPATDQPPTAVPGVATAPAAAVPVGAAAVPSVSLPTPTSGPAAEPATQVALKSQGTTEARSARKSEGKSEGKSDRKMGESQASEGTAEDASSTGPGHKAGSRVRSRGSEVRKASARTSRKKAQISNSDAEEFVRAASIGTKSRQKGNPPSAAWRSTDEDPDAVLPLSRH